MAKQFCDFIINAFPCSAHTVPCTLSLHLLNNAKQQVCFVLWMQTMVAPGHMASLRRPCGASRRGSEGNPMMVLPRGDSVCCTSSVQHVHHRQWSLPITLCKYSPSPCFFLLGKGLRALELTVASLITAGGLRKAFCPSGLG